MDRWTGELLWTVAVAIFNFNFIRGTSILFEWHRRERHNWTPSSLHFPTMTRH